MPKRKKSFHKHAPQVRSETSVARALSFRVLAGVALIIVAVFLAYFPAISGGFIFDDNVLLTNNPLVKSADGWRQFWRAIEKQVFPISNCTLWIEWRLWGMNPTGYHVTNLILHIIESLLIWLILRELSIPGAFWAALIFAIHPVNVESVAWIAQRKGLMAMLFFLLSILWYLKAEMDSSVRQYHFDRPWLNRWYWLSLAAFVLAMLSKGSVAVLPVLLLGIIWWRQKLIWRDVVRTMPFFLVAIVLTGVNVWFQTYYPEHAIRNATFLERLLGAGGVVWFYLYKGLLPIDLVFIYPQWHIEAGNPLWWLPLLATMIVTGVLWLYRETLGSAFFVSLGLFLCVAHSRAGLCGRGVYEIFSGSGSLSTYRSDWSNRASSGFLERLAPTHARSRTARGDYRGNRGNSYAHISDLAANQTVLRRHDAISNNAGKKSRLLDGPQ